MLFFDILWPVQSSYKLKFSLKNSANQRKVGWLLALEVMLYGWPWIAATVFHVYITVCVRRDYFNTWSTSKTTKILHLMYIIMSRGQCNHKLIYYYTNDWKQQENKKDWSTCFTVQSCLGNKELESLVATILQSVLLIENTIKVCLHSFSKDWRATHNSSESIFWGFYQVVSSFWGVNVPVYLSSSN